LVSILAEATGFTASADALLTNSSASALYMQKTLNEGETQ
jgi:hypothetical protein